jgi:hypothetical protein
MAELAAINRRSLCASGRGWPGDANCTGTFTITPQGESALNFTFVIVDSGKEMLALETGADTIVTATLQR